MDSNDHLNGEEILFISSRREGPHAVVELEGELDPSCADRIVALVQNMLTLLVETIDIDVNKLTFVDSAGLRALLLAKIEAEKVGSTFHIRGVTRPVARVIQVAGLSELLLPVEPDPT